MGNKISLLIFILILMQTSLSICGCTQKDYSDYKNEEGYQEYISDCNAGYEDVPYYYVRDSMRESESARKYFKKNSRRVGDFIITDYMDGVCINKYCGYLFGDDLIIPEEIGGKPVVKLGGYFEGGIETEDGDSKEIIGAFGGNASITIHIPSTVKVITQEAISSGIGMVADEDKYRYVYIIGFNVDKDNPYYCSSESAYGNLYTKDMKTLLFFCSSDDFESEYEYESGYSTIVIPNSIQNFAPANGISMGERLKFDKTIKKINTYIDMGEDGIFPDPSIDNEVVIYGYKGTVAEEWAKEYYATFVSLD